MRPASLDSRSSSRRMSRSAMERRLSWAFLPRATPISSLATPRVRYIFSGTIVSPFADGTAVLRLVDPECPIHLQRHHRQPLRRLQPEQLGDLVAMQQQLSGARRRMAVAVALRELGDVRADERGLSALHADIRLRD